MPVADASQHDCANASTELTSASNASNSELNTSTCDCKPIVLVDNTSTCDCRPSIPVADASQHDCVNASTELTSVSSASNSELNTSTCDCKPIVLVDNTSI